jgi:CheY-like chemotaxis protein
MSSPTQILIVDDDKEDHFILNEYFTDVGMQELVRYLWNGQEALDYLEAVSDTDLPKLIVLDLNMPILNGANTLVKLKQITRFKYIPVIVYSTSENATERKKCLSMGASDYLVKPSTLKEGTEIVQKFISYL